MRLRAYIALLLALTSFQGGSSQAATGDSFNKNILGNVLFSDTFSKMPVIDTGCSSKSARYVDQYCGQGSVNTAYPRTHGEHECYSDETFDGVNPFTLDPKGGLDINANKGLFIVPACSSAKYSSGMISTYNSFAMAHGYWEVEAQMPKGGQGRWPAIWLLNAHGGWPPELDIVEMASGVWYGSQRSATQLNSESAPKLGCLCDKPHIFGFLDTGSEVVWYVDNVEVQRQEMMAGTDVPYYLIINLAINGWSWTGQETATSTPATFRINKITAWGLK